MSDDETFRKMPSLAPSDPPSRSDEIDHQFRHLSYKLDNLDNRLDDLDTKLTDKPDDYKLDNLGTKLTDKLDDLDTTLEDLDTKLEDLDTKLEDLDTKLTGKLDDLDNQHIAMFKLCAVVAAFIALIYWGDKNDPWWFSAFKGVAYLWFLNWIGKK